MINRLKKKHFKTVFDADGLPLEERVDFSGLSKNSKQYKFLKKEEYKILCDADTVITRSQKAIAIHLESMPNENPEKFTVILNGRNADFFKPDLSEREKLRRELNISNQDKVFVYCGSLGPQYGLDIMIAIFQNYQKKNTEAKFLILTGNIEFAHGKIPNHLEKSILIRKVPFEKVPHYLNIANVAFAIREPKFSMQGVAPIKLGEYLLMGIPTIASLGIGDTEQILKAAPNCFLFNHHTSESIEQAVKFIEGLEDVNFEVIRNYGIEFFSLEKSANSYTKALNKIKQVK